MAQTKNQAQRGKGVRAKAPTHRTITAVIDPDVVRRIDAVRRAKEEREGRTVTWKEAVDDIIAAAMKELGAVAVKVPPKGKKA
jgi:hypothetical protein